MKKLYFLASVVCLALAACGGNKPTPEPTPDPEPGPGPEPPTPVAVTAVNLSQRSAELWVGDRLLLTATVKPDNADDKSVKWSSSNTAVGALEAVPDKDYSIIVTAVAEGEVTVTAKAGDITANCQIIVHAVEQPPYAFSLDPTSVELPDDGGEFVITVTCTGGYHMQSKPDWITEVSVDDKKHTFSASANESFDERKGVIVFCDDVGTCLPVQVTQWARETPPDIPFEITPTQVEVPAAGGEFQVAVQCSTGYHVNSMPDWVSEVSSADRLHTFSVGANPGTEARSGVIVFCDDVGTCLPCMVKQPGNEPANAAGGTEDVTDGTPVKW